MRARISLTRRSARRPWAFAVAASLVASLACERGPVLDAALADAPLPAADAPVDDRLADAGAWYFQRNCVACHSVGGGDAVGPDLAGVTERRSMTWIAAMIQRPDSMLAVDSVARALLDRYQVPMIDRQLDRPRLLAIVEFLRRADRGAPGGTAPSPPSGP